MPSVRGVTGRHIEFEEGIDGKMYVYAQIGDLPPSTVVENGSAGLIQWNNDGAPLFQLDGAAARNPTWGQLPAVAAGGGVKGDVIKAQVYGQAEATFSNSFDTRTHKDIRKASGVGMEAVATAPDNVLWGTVVGSGANSRTHTVFLDGAPTYTS